MKDTNQQRRRRILCYAVGGTCLTGLTIALVSLWFLYDASVGRMRTHLVSLLQGRLQNVTQFVSRTVSVAAEIRGRVREQGLTEQLHRREGNRRRLQRELARGLEEALRGSESLLGVTRLDSSQRVLAEAGLDLPPELLGTAGSTASLEDLTPQLAGPFVVDGTEVVLAVTPLRSEAGVPIGTDVALFDARPLRQAAGSSRLGSRSPTHFALARRGEDRTEIFAGNHPPMMQLRLQQLMGGMAVDALRPRNAGGLPVVRTDADLGEAVSVAYAPVEHTPWVAVLTADNSTFQSELLANLRVPALLMAALLLAGILAVAVAVLREVRKVADLGKLQEERRLREELAVSHQERDEFLNMVSHQLRSPLATVLGYTEILPELDPTTSVFRDGVRNTRQAALTLEQLLADLLDVSRVFTGKLALNPRECKVEDIVFKAVGPVRFTAERKGVDLKVRLEPGLPVIVADAARLQQATWNLVADAVKFTPRGGSVDVSARRADANIIISVKDTGPGVDPTDIPHLFRRLGLGKSVRPVGSARLSVGLGIARHLAELHGGGLDLSSAGPGDGFTYRILLPVPPVKVTSLRPRPKLTAAKAPPRKAPEMPAMIPVGESEETGVSLEGLRILIVDDQPSVAEMAAAVLRQAKAVVIPTESPIRGLDLHRRHGFDLILCDLNMPDVDGFEFIRRLRHWEQRKHRPVTPAIALTGLSDPVAKNAALGEGYQGYLVKPVDRRKLLLKISSVLEEHGKAVARRRVSSGGAGMRRGGASG